MAGENKIELIIGARDEASQVLDNTQKKLQAIANNWTQLGRRMMLTGGIGAGAILGVVKSTMDYGVAIDRFQKQTGMSVEQIQQLRYAAEQEHASFETLSRGIPILTKYMQYAASGMETYKREFDRMGVSVTDAKGNLRSAYDVLLDMADWMASDGVGDSEKLATAMTLLGRRGAELVPFLKLGKKGLMDLGNEIKETRGLLTEAQTTALKRFEDEMTKLKETTAGVKDQIAIALLPTLEKMIATGQGIAKWLRDLDPETKKNIANMALFVTTGLLVGGVLIFMGGQLAQVGIFALQALNGLIALGTGGATALIPLITAMGQLLLITAGLVALEETLLSIKGIKMAKVKEKEAKAIQKEQDEIRHAYESGKITKEEARERMRDTERKLSKLREETASPTFAMTGLERTFYEVDKFNTSIKAIKEEINNAKNKIEIPKTPEIPKPYIQPYDIGTTKNFNINILVEKEDEIGDVVNTAIRPIAAGY